MTAIAAPQELSDAVLSFSLHGSFPEDVGSLPPVSDIDLDPAVAALAKARVDLETQIHTINEETKDHVSSWVKTAKALQEDIITSKAIANEIVRQSEAPDISGETIKDAESKVEFMQREFQYSQQLHGVLDRIRNVNQLLSEVEQASKERRILDSLHLLEKAWAAIDGVGVSKSIRIMELLNLRSFELKSDVHEVFNHVWKALVKVDMDTGKLSIFDSHPDEPMSLNDAVIGLKAYKEVDERMEQLWRNIDAAIVSQRMDPEKSPIISVKVEVNTLELAGSSDDSVFSLLSDLETIFTFVTQRLPPDVLQPLSTIMMADVAPRLIQQWLDAIIPSGLNDMGNFEAVITRVKGFNEKLQQLGYTSFDDLIQWADKAPETWLEKYKETSLDLIRSRLSSGVGQSKRVEKIEKHMVSLAEGKELATSGAGAAAAADASGWAADWGDAWDDDENEAPPGQDAKETTAEGDDDGGDAWGWDDDDTGDNTAEKTEPEETQPTEAAADDGDDGTDAWGWEDDGAEPEVEALPSSPVAIQKPSPKAMKKMPVKASQREETRELILKETYSISSMPEPVLELIFSIFDNGSVLTTGGEQHSLVAKTAPGLFSLPTFVLALFRAISPYYYSFEAGGNMFLYNDAMYLSEKLAEFAAAWKEREDLTPRAKAMLRLDNDVKSLQSFANRSYSNEMSLQKTVLQDLLGSSQSVVQQDEKEDSIEAGKSRIRTVATLWEPILRRSVWSQAVGSLADSLASRLVSDVLEMSSIGQEEAYSIATLIDSATELDDLFLPSKLGGSTPTEDEMPATAQYAPSWLRLKYLREVLQSNLNEVKYLWCESELSLYFTVEDVIDLIHASFEDNPRTRETIKEIRARPAKT